MCVCVCVCVRGGYTRRQSNGCNHAAKNRLQFESWLKGPRALAFNLNHLVPSSPISPPLPTPSAIFISSLKKGMPGLFAEVPVGIDFQGLCIKCV